MNNIKAHLAIFIANLIYGINFVFSKDLVDHFLDPKAIVFIRVLFAVPFFWIVFLSGKRQKVVRKDLFLLVVCGVLGITVNQVLFFEGINLTTTINASIIMTINPILVLVFSLFIIKERITVIKSVGIFLGATGAMMIVLSAGNLTISSDTLVGNLFIFGNATSFALYLVLLKPLMVKYNSVTIIAWIFLFGAIGIVPVCFPAFFQTDFSSMTSYAWFCITFVVVFATIISYFLFNYSLKQLSPSITSSYIYLQPVIASGMSLFLGKETFSVTKLVAAVLIFVGVYLVSRKFSFSANRALK